MSYCFCDLIIQIFHTTIKYVFHSYTFAFTYFSKFFFKIFTQKFVFLKNF